MLPTFIFLFLLKFSFTYAVTCPSGGIFDPNFNRCYIYYSQPDIFLAAESTCRSIGGNLAEIRNGFENTFVAGIVYNFNNGTSSSAYWVGANLLMASRWTWTTNDTAVYTNWAADQPTDPSIYQCASVREDTYLWQKELCSSSRPFVCNAPATSSDDSPCDPGYSQYDNKCYRMFNNFLSTMDFDDSKQFCRDHQNATLPIVTSMGEQNYLESLIFNEKSDIFLGLYCRSTNLSSCWWGDRTQPISYQNFCPSQPGGAFTIALRITRNGCWDTEYPFWSFPVVVCEKPARNVNNVI